MKTYFNKVVLMLCTVVSGSAMAGLSLDSTRYIYHEDEQFLSSVVFNETEKEYGGQVWIDNIEEEDTRPTFVATPSFFRVKPDSRQVFRTLKVSEHMPNDRESIYWLNLQEIPPKQEGGGLSLAIRTRVKLIYRPAELKEGRNGAESEMTIEHLPGKTQLVNTTPYIFAVGSVMNQNGEAISVSAEDRDTLSMFLPGDAIDVTGHDVASIFALNDYGHMEEYIVNQGPDKDAD